MMKRSESTLSRARMLLMAGGAMSAAVGPKIRRFHTRVKRLPIQVPINPVRSSPGDDVASGSKAEETLLVDEARTPPEGPHRALAKSVAVAKRAFGSRCKALRRV